MSRLFVPLRLPESKDAQAPASKEGETLRSIAQRFHMKESELRDINSLRKQVSRLLRPLLRVFRKKKRSISLSALSRTAESEEGDLEQPEGSPGRRHVGELKSGSKGCSHGDPAPRWRDGLHREVEVVVELPVLIGGTASELLSQPKYLMTLVPQLHACLPSFRRYYDWQLLYSLAQHGCSLQTLLSKVRRETPTLIVVETTRGEVFGGFTTEAWQKSANYYGFGESFVFSCTPVFEHFAWSSLNTMLMFSNDDSIAMGGGGNFAWHLNADLSRGTSGPSTTFMNTCLTSEPDFDIYHVEVWGFVTKI